MHILFFQDLLGVARRGRRESNDNTTTTVLVLEAVVSELRINGAL